jgi:hypothetical protein
MGEQINQEFEEFQKVLTKKEKKLKYISSFRPDERTMKIIDDLIIDFKLNESDRRNENTGDK